MGWASTAAKSIAVEPASSSPTPTVEHRFVRQLGLKEKTDGSLLRAQTWKLWKGCWWIRPGNSYGVILCKPTW